MPSPTGLFRVRPYSQTVPHTPSSALQRWLYGPLRDEEKQVSLRFVPSHLPLRCLE